MRPTFTLVALLVVILLIGSSMGGAQYRSLRDISAGSPEAAGHAGTRPTSTAANAPGADPTVPVGVGGYTFSAGFDSANGFVYTAGLASSSFVVSVISGTSVIKELSIQSGGLDSLEGPWIDEASGLVYFVSWNSSTTSFLTIINGTNLIGGLELGGESSAAAFDSATGELYVMNSGTANLSVVNGTALVATIGLPGTPSAVLYDDSDQLVYVAIPGISVSDLIEIQGLRIAARQTLGSLSQTLVSNPRTGEVVALSLGSDGVSFIDGTSLIGTATVPFEPALALFNPSTGLLYVEAGSGEAVGIFSNQTLLSELTVSNQPGPVGQMISPPGRGTVFVDEPAVGMLAVLNGTALIAQISIVTASQVGSDAPSYMAAGQSSGYLYLSTQLGANAGGDSLVSVIENTTAVQTFEVSGAEAQTPLIDGLDGWVYVPNLLSTDVTVIVPEPIATFPVTIRESGLSAGSMWEAEIGDTTAYSTDSTLAIEEPNGSRDVELGTSSAFSASPSSVPVLVDGSPVQIDVQFIHTGGPSSATFELAILTGGITIGVAICIFSALSSRRLSR